MVKKQEQGDKRTNAQIILDSAVKKIFKHYLSMNIKNHIELYQLITISKLFHSRVKDSGIYLANIVYNEHDLIVNSETIKEVVNILSAKAEFDESSKTIKLNLRVAESEDIEVVL